MHNFAPTTHLVWARLELFAAQVLALREVDASIRAATDAPQSSLR
jgi:hypothetical protein